MKKAILGLLLSSCFVAGAAHAEDRSAVVDIHGVLSAPSEGDCSVLPSTTSIALDDSIDKLPLQGSSAAHLKSTFTVTVGGDLTCIDKIESGRVGIKFTGTVDNANGTVLANMATSEGAAKGVGVGLYNPDGSPLNITTYRPIINPTTPIGLGLQIVRLDGQTPEAGSIQSAMTIEVVRL
ncbi:type 1 fimbrial protein [Cronobacter dublinensis]|uniref:fimbrial protein n=1 Tax=Cronobacter muytjensii TaxID=413501 RepID=UPI0015880DE0|nr:fimbrial protein [Cronobacter muytjensii]ELY2857078.1 type 1 fimbrial protein [Cronobacter dublinensis]NUW59751.1 type 1 fimbrial protein [Cronobacter muytjensii]